jgi:hypothetical protein
LRSCRLEPRLPEGLVGLLEAPTSHSPPPVASAEGGPQAGEELARLRLARGQQAKTEILAEGEFLDLDANFSSPSSE